MLLQFVIWGPKTTEHKLWLEVLLNMCLEVTRGHNFYNADQIFLFSNRYSEKYPSLIWIYSTDFLAVISVVAVFSRERVLAQYSSQSSIVSEYENVLCVSQCLV